MGGPSRILRCIAPGMPFQLFDGMHILDPAVNLPALFSVSTATGPTL